jgi:hypothetical protein
MAGRFFKPSIATLTIFLAVCAGVLAGQTRGPATRTKPSQSAIPRQDGHLRS